MSTGRMDGIQIRIRDRSLLIQYEGMGTNDETGEPYTIEYPVSEEWLREMVKDIASDNRDMTDEQLWDVLLNRLSQEKA